jgi:nucleoside-diphosphate-sugar epimerase
MIVLVTGASGWVGGRTARELLRAGAEVRCLVEPGTDGARLPADAEAVTADVRDADGVAAAMAEVEAVVHCAAVIHPARARLFREVNEAGTRHVVEAAARAGVRRLVHVSSNAAAGFQREREVLLTEDDPPRPRGGYGTSKLAAERAVLAAHAAGSLEATVIRPCRCYGPGQPPRVERVFRMIRTGTVPVIGDGGALRSMSFVDDVVRVVAQCLDDPNAAGETFWIADGRPYTTLEAFAAMAAAAEVPLRARKVPEAAARVCEALDLALERAGRYSMSLHLAGESRHDIGCSVDKARRVLGFEPRDDLVGGFRAALAASPAAPALVAA